MTQNRLSSETSPYLLQHKDNPVHWFPWGSQAFEEAKSVNKPILLSIGYAACHWCHVMAHESFEDQSTADLMNALFINIKVDREERPDVDKIYMDAIHSLGEQGGWPLTMFLTADAEPFWGGTYFPTAPQYGRPGFKQVLQEISRIWNQERGKIKTNAAAIKQALHQRVAKQSNGQLTFQSLQDAASTIVQAIDLENGGLAGAPKFPQTSIFNFLWQMRGSDKQGHIRQAVERTLTKICQGGIYDHLGGGFSRYSVDRFWLVPHFEKMLYDNAQLIELLANVWAETKRELFRLRIEETVRWLLEDMAVGGTAFAASYDADSEGVEGKFYVWTESEIAEHLAQDNAELFCRTYDVTPSGNWERANILNRLKTLDLLGDSIEKQLATSRATLLNVRNNRIPPGWDDKILTDWNGLTIKALARAGLLLDRQDWIAAAITAFDFIIANLWKQGTLYHSHRAGKTQHLATADSYANLVAAAIALNQATANQDYIETAQLLTAAMNNQHWNTDDGGYYFSSHKAENLIVRPYYAHDDATPNANATMLRSLTDLYLLTGGIQYQQRATQIHDAFAAEAARVVSAHAGFLAAFEHFIEPVQAVIVGPIDDPATHCLKQAIVKSSPMTTLMLHISNQQDLPSAHIAKAQSVKDGQVAVFICRGQTCSLPISNPADVVEFFAKSRAPNTTQ